ncbi:MAG: hypothetical protein HBSAPP01_13090 [Candidatus Brocadia sapporoensis]|nr:MAG: hypothetical protein HBSAPP01_13090 [Candidatus Brocadia sapporoensis]
MKTGFTTEAQGTLRNADDRRQRAEDGRQAMDDGQQVVRLRSRQGLGLRFSRKDAKDAKTKA